MTDLQKIKDYLVCCTGVQTDDGVVIAMPRAAIVKSALGIEYSNKYVVQFFDQLQKNGFVLYHFEDEIVISSKRQEKTMESADRKYLTLKELQYFVAEYAQNNDGYLIIRAHRDYRRRNNKAPLL